MKIGVLFSGNSLEHDVFCDRLLRNLLFLVNAKIFFFVKMCN